MKSIRRFIGSRGALIIIIMDESTLSYYSANAEAYDAETFHADMRHIYGMFRPLIPPGGRILDLGCGTGRDSAYFLSLGYSVEAIDGTPELCRIAALNTGLDVRCMDFMDLDLQDAFDGAWACASLLHLRRAELPDAMRRIHRALHGSGVLYCSFKYGTSCGERGGRYYTDLDEGSFRALASASGFRPISISITGDVRSGHADERWLNAVSRTI